MALLFLGLFLSSIGPIVSGLPATRGWCDNKKSLDLSLQLAGLSPEVRTWASAPSANPRHNLDVPQMVAREGYPVETHLVTTEDCYLLTLHRIPHGRNNGGDGSPRPIMFLQHGLLCSSADWVMPTPSKGLGYILADAGYDVWMGNYRGNTYSRSHCSLDPDNQRGDFWKFTWDEMAKYDIPAMIEKVLKVTGQDELQYAGHSMGTTAFMAMHHYRKDISQKVRLAHLLSPVAYVGHMTSPIGWIAGLDGIIETIVVDLMGIGEFLPSNLLMDCLASLFCHEGVLQGLCTNILFVLCGFDEPQVNTTLLETIIHHTPAGASSKTILHYAQEVNSNKFEGYDWGSDPANMAHHGSLTPPEYLLSDVTTPTAIYWGDNDWLAAAADILQVVMQLPNIQPGMNHEVAWPGWNHLDFLWGVDADKYVYADLVKNAKTCQDEDCRLNK